MRPHAAVRPSNLPAQSLVLAVALLALVLQAPMAGAQQAAPATLPAGGTVTARLLGKVPADPVVFVSPYDDSELNLKLQADFERRIADTGKARLATTEAGAGFLLLFESEVVAADQVPHQANIGSARVDQGGAEVNVNVWSNTQDSVIGGRQEEADPKSSVFHINAVLRDQKSGEVVWQGDAYHVLREPGTERVARAMVLPLVKTMGETVARAPIEIE